MTLMDENEELLELLKPGMAMLKEWFDYKGDNPIIVEVQESAQRLDYLLGAAVAAYQFIIQKSESEPDKGLTEWHCRYKRTDSELISFYTGMHCWALSRIATELSYTSQRSEQKIRSTLLREIMFKQLELCRLMVNYSIEGDSWGRVFRGAVSLIDLIDPDEDRSMVLTQMAIWECVPFDEDDEEFRYPRFNNLNSGTETLLTLLGVGVDATLYIGGHMPRALNESGVLRAHYDSRSGEIITISYETTSSLYYREKGFWWNFGHEGDEFFDDDNLEIIYIRAEFIERFDLDEAHGERVHEREMAPYALTYEELHPND